MAFTSITSDGAGGYYERTGLHSEHFVSNGHGGFNSFGHEGVTSITSNGHGGFNTIAPEGISHTVANGAEGFNTFGPHNSMSSMHTDGAGGFISSDGHHIMSNVLDGFNIF